MCVAEAPSTKSPEVLIKSKRRVKEHGEVFTPRYMVDQMLDLVSYELESGPGFVDKTFLEPAAGDGNFLVRILQRKLKAIEKTYKPEDWTVESLFALASIYGIELLEDNHQDAQEWLLSEFCLFHQSHGTTCNWRTNLYRSAKYIISVNILQGNTLTGMRADGDPIVFSWWNRVPDSPGTVQREPFSLESLQSESLFDLMDYDSYKPCPCGAHVFTEEGACRVGGP